MNGWHITYIGSCVIDQATPKWVKAWLDVCYYYSGGCFCLWGERSWLYKGAVSWPRLLAFLHFFFWCCLSLNGWLQRQTLFVGLLAIDVTSPVGADWSYRHVAISCLVYSQQSIDVTTGLPGCSKIKTVVSQWAKVENVRSELAVPNLHQICTPRARFSILRFRVWSRPMNVCADTYGVIQRRIIRHHLYMYIYTYVHVIINNLCLSYDPAPCQRIQQPHYHLLHSRLLLHNINAFPQRNPPSIFVRQNFPITRVSIHS